MSEYNPDNWVVLKVKHPKLHYRVLAGWSGSYFTGDSWRINSGITRVDDDGDNYFFYGNTGSVYRCHKSSYGLRGNNAHIYEQLKNKYGGKIEMLDEGTNWLKFDWSPK